MIVLIAGGLGLSLLPGHLLAQYPSFGMIGIASNQTLRLNLIAYPADPCTAQLSFVNAAGAPCGTIYHLNLSAG